MGSITSFQMQYLSQPRNEFFCPSSLSQNDVLHSCSATIPCKSVSIDTWHKRLGHMFISSMQLLPFINRNDSLSHCCVCPLSKQSRLVFPQASQSKSLSAFNLVHMDIWGPFNTPNYNGDKYFLTIVDDFTRGT